jgi:methylamine dehydrogenase heavy chain
MQPVRPEQFDKVCRQFFPAVRAYFRKATRSAATAATLSLMALAALTLVVMTRAHAATESIKVDPLAALQLPAKPSPHWVWVNDVVFHHMADGKAFLLDGDRGTMLGMLSTGFEFNGLVLPRNGAAIFSPEIYFSRGTRGTRTDVVTIYDPRTLSPLGEIAIPPKRVSSTPMSQNAALTDDDRFLLIYNFTPAQSVSVVDITTKKLIGEIEIAGCALVYPNGPRGFFSLCGDGTALQVTLNDQGKVASKARSARLFDPEHDPITEKAVRDGNTWLFVSVSGMVVPVEMGAAVPKLGQGWSLLDDQARKESWRPGGVQHLSFHPGDRRLYSLMHIGGRDTHKDQGTEVWIYDVAAKKRIQRFKLQNPTMSIMVTKDATPLVFAIFADEAQIDVYDGRGGRFLRSIKDIGITPMTFTAY